MAKIIIGIDPDSEYHGVSEWVDGKLTDLKMMQLMDLYEYSKELIQYGTNSVEAHIENVSENSATFIKRGISNARANTKVSLSVGRCQQAQVELERMFESLCIPVFKHKISNMWKEPASGKKILESLGWTARSNEDTRSAAYFGYLGVKSIK